MSEIAVGPMERLNQACENARVLDAYLRADCEASQLESSKQLAYSLEVGVALIGREAKLTGSVLTPLIDADGDFVGLDFSSKPSEAVGIYRGLQVVPVDIIVSGEITGLHELRVVHLLEVGTNIYTDRITGKHTTEVSFERFGLDTSLVPQTLYGSHSHEFLNRDKPSQAICQEIEELVFDEQLPDTDKLVFLTRLINRKAGIIRDSDERYQNILSYLNSLGTLEEVGVVAPFSMSATDDSYIIHSPRSGSYVFSQAVGYDISQKLSIKDKKIIYSNRQELYVACIDDNGDPVLAPASRSEFVADNG